MSKRRPLLSQRNERGIRPRPVEILPVRKRFLIVCEGAKTEPNYFRSFRLNKDVRSTVVGAGMNTESLVQYAIDIRTKELNRDSAYDEVWCVFDTDSFSRAQINAALSLAKTNKIRIAYSNEAFELWYILHFDYLETGITRAQYIDKLKSKFSDGYQKNDPAIYDKLKKDSQAQKRAIKYARKLLAIHPQYDPAANKPSTTVHVLVLELNKHVI